jgi:hypothetical protein
MVTRFDSSVAPDAIARILTTQAGAWRKENVAAVRLSSRTTDHPVYTTTRPNFMVVAEWSGRPANGAALVEGLTRSLKAQGAVSRRITFEGHRIYPWPND